LDNGSLQFIQKIDTQICVPQARRAACKTPQGRRIVCLSSEEGKPHFGAEQERIRVFHGTSIVS